MDNIMSESSEVIDRDWPEDFEHENGNYMCRCVHCNNTFTGHKRRVVCRACATSRGERRKVRFVRLSGGAVLASEIPNRVVNGQDAGWTTVSTRTMLLPADLNTHGLSEAELVAIECRLQRKQPLPEYPKKDAAFVAARRAAVDALLGRKPKEGENGEQEAAAAAVPAD